MAKYHIRADGTPGVCHAHEGRCPLGGASGSENHFNTKEEAQAAIDKEHMNSFTDASREHAHMQTVDWKKFTPYKNLNGVHRMTIDEDLVRLNDKYINDTLHIAGDSVRFRAYMNATSDVGTSTNVKEVQYALKERPEVFNEYKETPQLTELENGSFDEYKSAVQDWTYTKMNYERDGDINRNPDFDRKHFDEVDWDNANLQDDIDSKTMKERGDELRANKSDEDRDEYVNAYNKLEKAETVDDVNKVVYGNDGDGTVGEAYLNTPGHDAADFYRSSNQVDKYKSAVSDFLYISANKI